MPNQIRELISIVMPVYRESSHIEAVLREVQAAFEPLDVGYEIVLIDDGSPDDTWAVLNRLRDSFPAMRAARLSRNFGKELALTAGLEMARGDAVVVMDADGQHPPSLLPEMLRVWRETGVDIVEASKVDRGDEDALSKFGAGTFYFLWNKLSGFEMKGASDYKLLSRRALDAYLQLDERNVFFRGMTAWLGFERASVPFEVATRAGGSSSWSVIKRIRLAVSGISSFSALPLQLVTLAGVLFLVFALLFGLQTLYVYLVGQAVTGFATVILLILIVGSLLMISLGIIGIYLARIYDEIKGRPRYIISQSIDSSTPAPRSDENTQPIIASGQ